LGVWHVWGWRRREMLIGFWGGNLKEGGHLDGQGVDGRVILK